MPLHNNRTVTKIYPAPFLVNSELSTSSKSMPPPAQQTSPKPHGHWPGLLFSFYSFMHLDVSRALECVQGIMKRIFHLLIRCDFSSIGKNGCSGVSVFLVKMDLSVGRRLADTCHFILVCQVQIPTHLAKNCFSHCDMKTIPWHIGLLKL